MVKKSAASRPKPKPFDNEERTRYYGVRVGDTVTQQTMTGIVKKYDVFDNNCVWVAVEGKESLQKFIPEWCVIIKRVDDVETAALIVEEQIEETGFTPPLTIIVSTDGNVLEFIEYSNKTYYYKYTASEYKLGYILPITLDNLKKFILINETLKAGMDAAFTVSALRADDFL